MIDGSIFKRIREQSQLAEIYIADGAPNSAADVLQRLADDVKEWAEQTNAFAKAAIAALEES